MVVVGSRAAVVALVASGTIQLRHQIDNVNAAITDRIEAIDPDSSLGEFVAEARVAERTRIAREMHDVLAHRLSLLATHAGALEYRPDAPPDRIAAAAGVVRAGVHEALEDLRQVIGVLRDDGDGVDAGAAGSTGGDEPAWRRPQPVLADIPALVDEARSAGGTVRLIDEVAADPPPAAVGRTAYRIVQEALTNARKHAPGSPVTVRLLGGAAAGLSITVDNPTRTGTATPSPPRYPGGSPIPGSGTGLVGLAERARLAGGRLDHDASDGDRFRLSAWLPWPE
jgi:signal transduction histidine kinase